MKALRPTILILLLAGGLGAQNPTQPQPLDSTTLAVHMLNPPIPPGGVTVGFSGAPGSSAKIVYYWLVSNFTVGNSTVGGPYPGYRAPTTLSGSNFFTIYWQPVAGANSYDLLRTSSPAPPTGASNCAVATGISGTSQTDQSNSLNAYTVTTFDPNDALVQLDSEAIGAGPANVHYMLRQKNALVCDLIACGGAVLASGGNLAPGNLFAGTASNQRDQTLFVLIPGSALTPAPNFKLVLHVNNGGGASTMAVGQMAMLRTAIATKTVLDSTPVTIGGSGTPSIAVPGTSDQNDPQVITTDTINLALDNTHDYYFAIYFSDVASNSLYGISNSPASMLPTFFVGSNHVGDATIPFILAWGTGAPGRLVARVIVP